MRRDVVEREEYIRPFLTSKRISPPRFPVESVVPLLVIEPSFLKVL